MKEFDPVPAFVHEDVYVSIRRVPSNLVPYQTAQCMKALSHIRWIALKLAMQLASQTKHGSIRYDDILQLTARKVTVDPHHRTGGSP